MPTVPSYARARKPQKAPPPPNWTELYLAELEVTGRQVAAAAAALVSVNGVRYRRTIDPAFARAEREALANSRVVAIDELTRRAIHGTDVVTITGTGKNRREVRRTVYSDTLLLRLLEYQETGSFRLKQQLEHSGGIASAPTLADAKRRLAEAMAASAADEAASLGYVSPAATLSA